MRKVLLIGLDGATFDVIKPLVEAGKLPVFRKLMTEGIYGDLRSTIPPATVPAWPSFSTGMNPGKHGVFDFMKRTKNQYYGSLVTSHDVRSRTIWEILGSYDKKSIVINIPLTWPPKPINGILVSGMLTPQGQSFAYPPEIENELRRLDYIIELDSKVFNEQWHKPIFLEKLYLVTQKRLNASIYLMSKYQWDFFAVLFRGTDFISHKLWANREAVNAYYQQIDKVLAELVGNIDSETIVMLISDHGHGELRKTVHINKWLSDLSLLNCKKVDINSTRASALNKIRGIKEPRYLSTKFLSKLGITRENVMRLARKSGLKKIKDYVPNIVEKLLSNLPATSMDIDWANTKVFLSSFFGTETQSIMINLKGREPQGIVDPSEYEELRDRVIKELKELKDPETGESILEGVYKREELYWGPYVRDAPDLIMLLKGQYKASSSVSCERIITPLSKVQGSHRLYGIFVAYGPCIKRGATIENARIIDLAPTILHIINVPIPKGMDGKVLREIFKDDSELEKREIVYQDEGGKEEMKKRIRRLKELGKI